MIEIDFNLKPLASLREANEVRGIEWSNGAEDGGLFYAIELIGEIGELANVIKKLERERLGMVGSRASKQDLIDELGDAYICVDLLAIAYGRRELTLLNVVNAGSALEHTVSLGRTLGDLMGNVLDAEGGMAAELQWSFDHNLELALYHINAIAKQSGVNLRDAIIGKFNKTSDKYGLQTRLHRDARIG